MKVWRLTIYSLLIFLLSCDTARVYESNTDLASRIWRETEVLSFEFEITDTVARYNLYCNLRNSLDFATARIFLEYQINGPGGKELDRNLIHTFLFERKTGTPLGSSSLGDLYDHQVPIRQKITFELPGIYTVKFRHQMRVDSLPGILAVGLRVERVMG